MTLNRRAALKTILGTAAALELSCTRHTGADALSDSWGGIRELFELSPEYIHLAGLLLASHPRPVSRAIEEFRRELDINPAFFMEENNRELEEEVRRAAADYLGTSAQEIALTDNTTMAIALVYNGIELDPEQEMLTTEHDYYSTHAALEYKASRTGASIRKIRLFDRLEAVTEDSIVERLAEAVQPNTRIVALTWVHSSTGLKIPISRIGETLQEINRGRSPRQRALLCVDGVHALGVENFRLPDLNCDFFMAGTHKWLMAPRGTGILWGNPRSQDQLLPTIPTFSRWDGWGGFMTPGGFHSFEHRWALAHAFQFQQQLGKDQVESRIRELSRRLKEGLAQLPHVRLHTPMDDDLSAGIVCFDVDGMTPGSVVSTLLDRRIVASETPYDPSHARFTPAIFNSVRDIDMALQAVADLS